MNGYEDIIHREGEVPIPQGRMCGADRAAQFSAFAALTGFDGVIRESGRLTENAIELDEGEKLAINQALLDILQEDRPLVKLTWFRPDSRKEGGAFVSYTGILKKLDSYQRLLIFADGTQIPLDAITEIEGRVAK